MELVLQIRSGLTYVEDFILKIRQKLFYKDAGRGSLPVDWLTRYGSGTYLHTWLCQMTAAMLRSNCSQVDGEVRIFVAISASHKLR